MVAVDIDRYTIMNLNNMANSCAFRLYGPDLHAFLGDRGLCPKSHSTATTKLAPQANRQGCTSGAIKGENKGSAALDSFPASCCRLFKHCNALVCAFQACIGGIRP